MKKCAEQNDVCTIVEDVWGDTVHDGTVRTGSQ